MYFDLNIPSTSADKREEIINQLIQLSYDAIAWTKVTSGQLANVKELVKEQNVVPVGGALDLGARDVPLRQYTRLTVVLEETNQLHALSTTSPILQNFNIIAVQPATDKLFHTACTQLDVDIITLDLSRKLDFSLKHPSVRAAIARGVCFEISYGAALRDSTCRRHLISNALNLVRVSKGRGVVLTSQAQSALEIRGPYDVINLCSLFGVRAEVARQWMSSNCHSVLLHGETRRIHKGVVSLQKISSLTLEDQWKLPPVLPHPQPPPAPSDDAEMSDVKPVKAAPSTSASAPKKNEKAKPQTAQPPKPPKAPAPSPNVTSPGPPPSHTPLSAAVPPQAPSPHPPSSTKPKLPTSPPTEEPAQKKAKVQPGTPLLGSPTTPAPAPTTPRLASPAAAPGGEPGAKKKKKKKKRKQHPTAPGDVPLANVRLGT